jgi:prepilin-type N-terminal cleavage/methylation domain-containing protein
MATAAATSKDGIVGRARGMTLVELLLASSIMALAVAAIASLGSAAQSAAAYGGAHGSVVEQGRMISGRIARTVEEATFNENFPGFIVISSTVDGGRYPDALAVWRGGCDPNDSGGDPRLPLKEELVIYTPHPIFVNTLVELTMPGNAASVPAISDTAAWQTLLLTAQLGASSKQIVLTRQLRVCTTNGEVLPVGYNQRRRGAVRFESRLRPSEAELDTLDWDEMAWPQSIHSAETGLRQAWLRFELQLMPEGTVGAEAVPFFGSASLYYDMKRPE